MNIPTAGQFQLPSDLNADKTSSKVGGASANAAAWFVDRHALGEIKDKPAFTEAGSKRTLTYRELGEQSARVVGLLERHGVRREERIALLLIDQLEFPVIFWGALKAGVVPVALNTLLTSGAYETILRDCRARTVFVSRELLGTVAPALQALPDLNVFVIDPENEQTLSAEPLPLKLLPFAAELAASTPGTTLPVAADECAFWLYSSGSTGQPKGVRHVHSSLRQTAVTYGAQVLEVGPDDVIFSVAKLFFAYGLGNAMTFPLSVGATTILLGERPTPESVLALVNSYQPTIFCGVPTLYAALAEHLASGKGTLSGGAKARLRRCISAGEALPKEVGRNWERLVGCELLDGVGTTEMLHIFLSNRPGSVVYGTSGEAVPGYDIRLLNEYGEETEVEELGELLVRGPSAASDYWNQRDKSRSTFEGSWTRTGDKYRRLETGRLVYCGRTDDMFKVSGIWVSPFEVEQSLVSHPAVLGAAVVAAPDADGLDKPKAFVVLKDGALKDGASAEELGGTLKAHVKEQIGKWKYPRWIEVVDDLPKTATGKVQRFRLRAPVGA